ncbi:hypothetical protein MICA_1393 [Micavibrio aeruginosavorus ARL-13]|uniref:Uncharacterized protein n=1 Tax=Micavibrio aeruginosavorus (strain ARL-13) TaxID=856793 RepID=G2KM15_MICAA|nr:hypothetical protein MICA_1393 [Micavibrio aeruginosavorus ARL-13]
MKLRDLRVFVNKILHNKLPGRIQTTKIHEVLAICLIFMGIFP